MLKRLRALLTFLITAWKTKPFWCFVGLHRWKEESGMGNITHLCTREGCLRARAETKKGWHYFDREEVTVAQVAKLNRHERRRLGAMARRGAFGKVD